MAARFFRDPRAFALALLLILSMGLSAALTSGRQEDPTITNLFATILTPYPGADPARVEALVTEKIEEELRKVSEIDEIISISRSGLSFQRVQLVETLSDAAIERAWTDIRNALDDAARAFPPGVPEPEFTNDRIGAFTLIFALSAAEGAEEAPAILAREAEALADRLRALPGAALAQTYGAPREEVAVTLAPETLTGLGMSLREVAALLAAADAKAPAGQVRGATRDFGVALDGAFDGLARIRDTPLRAKGDATLRLGDVAEVARSRADPPDSLALLDGRPTVLVAVRAEDDLQVDAWAARGRDAAAAFAEGLPASIEQRLIFDQSGYTAARFAELGANIAMGVGLVSLVLLVTLGWRAALTVASALPLAAMIALFVLGQIGLSIHQMSVTGMIVALGLLVDAAIVMTDAIKRRIDAGEDRVAAIAASVKLLRTPLVASTATTVLSFLPMALSPGPVGDFIGSIALAVIAMLGASLLLALTLTPALAGWLLPAPDPSRRRMWWRDGVAGGAAGRIFARSLSLAMRRPLLSVLAALALPVAGFASFPTLTAQFFPGADRDQFHVQVTLAEGAALDATLDAARTADDLLRAAPEVRKVAWVIGESAPAFYYNMMMDQDGVSRFAEALVATTSPEATIAAIPRLQAALDRALPQAQVVVRPLVQGPPVSAPLEIRIVGPDIDLLRELGLRARAEMARTPGVTLARDTGSDGGGELRLALDPDALRLAGLDHALVAAELAAMLDGAQGGSVVEGSEELPVMVRLARPSRDAAGDVGALGMPGGAPMGWSTPGAPLAALGPLRLRPEGAPIHRRNGERMTLAQGFVAPDVLPEEALRDLRPRLDAALAPLPPGYRVEIGGDSDARADTVGYLMATVGLVVTLTVATLTLSFGSFRLMAATLVVAVLAAGLALLSLAVFRYPFGVTALIGVIGSVGVSVNAAIIIFSALQADEGARAGDPDAMARVTAETARHIVSTTVTTFGGFLPLILGGGGFWPPFATAIAGGVLLSTVVSFYFVPPVWALIRPREPRPAPSPLRPAWGR
ncbi:efflux RND transporter permease subunit [Rubrimonas sp.]|uniref:efflux RND transporter permease subunit n=1 Tax=Rubrimonas sp. TaxID=2036015 RepID=UPI002FDCCF60